ncbi:MAG: hypothetical protein ACKPE3_33945 [Sphaerospermopsis kisseleviana]
MRLFLVEKIDACGKHDAQYIVQAISELKALDKVNLSPDDVREMNEPYKQNAFPRYKVTVEEINFNGEGFYVLDC